MPTLSALYRYPIKSTAGETLTRAAVAEEGLRHDRRFMVVKPGGGFVTARKYPALQRVCARFDGGQLSLMHDDHAAVVESRHAFAARPFDTHVWADDFTALTTTFRLDAWFSRIMGEPVHLLWLGERSNRYREKIGTRVSFADGHPLLLTTEASLADVNARAAATHVMLQFRPNVVVAGGEAFAEDGWTRIRIGEVVFRVAKPCKRCVMTTVDPATGRRRPDGEPTRTLARYRKGDDNEIYFGQKLIAENTGELVVGQDVEILE
ncbi:MOSC domain-containing protein [Salinisphaera sp.]|uniref:MOSC domain-containing protein n=1 Tax=Salinisphaera sp. TaxID=1914330 RepID=UPI002D78BB36|nr:MOSC domain-containing protein [Salinisphaera sp.]HET7315130.1 MOSC domain-containing protein [Salinisphaera sp.]